MKKPRKCIGIIGQSLLALGLTVFPLSLSAQENEYSDYDQEYQQSIYENADDNDSEYSDEGSYQEKQQSDISSQVEQESYSEPSYEDNSYEENTYSEPSYEENTYEDSSSGYEGQ